MSIFDELNAAVPERVSASSVALIGGNPGVRRLVGSAQLLRWEGQHCIVTAEHVLAQARDFSLTLGITGSSNRHLIALDGDWMSCGEPIDIGFQRLSGRVVERLPPERFIDSTEIAQDHSGVDRGQWHVLCGYPQVWSDTSVTDAVKLKPLQYVCLIHDGAVTGLGGYDERFHMLLQASDHEVYDLAGHKVRFRTIGGFPAKFPSDLGGISGCSVWRIDPSLHAPPKLVGTVTGVYPASELIKATCISLTPFGQSIVS